MTALPPRPSLVVRLRGLYDTLAREVAKFGTVGALAFVLDTVLYNVLVFGVPGVLEGPLAGHPLTGKIVSASVATVFSWLGNRLWTFRHRRRSAVAHEFALFLVFNAVGLAIALACLGFSRYVLGLDSQLADNVSGNGVGLVLGTLFRFWAYRTFVFRGELEAEERGEPEDEELDVPELQELRELREPGEVTVEGPGQVTVEGPGQVPVDEPDEVTDGTAPGAQGVWASGR